MDFSQVSQVSISYLTVLANSDHFLSVVEICGDSERLGTDIAELTNHVQSPVGVDNKCQGNQSPLEQRVQVSSPT